MVKCIVYYFYCFCFLFFCLFFNTFLSFEANVEVAVLGCSSLTVLMFFCGCKATVNSNCQSSTAQELCESRGGRPGLPVPNSPYCFCGHKATLKNRAQALCESRGGRPGLPSLIVRTVSGNTEPNLPDGQWSVGR